MKATQISVMFVCMGNICRSPTAHGVFQLLVDQAGLSDRIRVDSAGTHAYHIGDAPDPRSAEMAKLRGVDISNLRAMKVTKAHFNQFDFMLAMDNDNLAILESIKPVSSNCHLGLMLDYGAGGEVPDPYYGGEQGFVKVYDLVYDACEELLSHIQEQHL